jgi:cytochrome c oxidase cbb3-type subunit IV
MIQNCLSSIEHVGILPSIAFLAFFIFFIVMMVIVLKADKNEIKKMSELPLNEK